MSQPDSTPCKKFPRLTARTLSILESWERNYGLDAIKDHLDLGLFSKDDEQQRLSYAWVKHRKLVLLRKAIAFALAVTAAMVAASAYIFEI